LTLTDGNSFEVETLNILTLVLIILQI